jgi:chemotaxis protein CheX
MHIKIVNAFVKAAQAVLAAETTLSFARGEMELSDHVYLSDEVTVIISLVGQVRGTVLYSLAEADALTLAGYLLGEPFAAFTPLAQSGIAELGNVITGQATGTLAEAGCEVSLSPPTLLIGKGMALSTLDLPRLVVSLKSDMGVIGLHLALRQTDV